MIPLVTKTDLDKFKYVAESVRNSTLWGQFVSEAQLLDVKPWLGDALLFELITQAATSPSSFSPKNVALLEGGQYTHQDRPYLFQGLKAVIIYYAFARFTNRSPYAYTAAGIVQKDSDLSTPVSDKVVQRLETEARLTAEAIRDELVLFLNRNSSTYTLWGTGSCYAGRRSGRTFKVIGD